MKNIFQQGDTKTFAHKVTAEDTATFESGTVHNVYSTFALGRDAEWCTRLFTIDMKDEDEESIGTALTIQHIASAGIGSEVVFIGTYQELNGNQVICSFEANVGSRLIAKGTTAQKILKKEKLRLLLSRV